MTSLPRTRSLSFKETFDGAALRVLHSRPYFVFSTSVAVVSLATLMWSLVMSCPGVAYISIEVVINVLVLGEVIVRLYVTGFENIWSSISSVIDMSAVVICVVSLVVLMMDCSRLEKFGDVVLLVMRNSVQIARLYLMVKRNKEAMTRMESRVDFSTLLRTESSRGASGVSDDDDDDDDENNNISDGEALRLNTRSPRV